MSPARIAAPAAVALLAVLALGACAAPADPGTTPAGPSSSQVASAGASGGPAEVSLPADATSTELVDQLEGAVSSFTQEVGGEWTFGNGEEFVARGDPAGYPADLCRVGLDYEDDRHGKQFQLTLNGPENGDGNEALMERARQWGEARGYDVSTSGPGLGTGQGGLSLALTADGLTDFTWNLAAGTSILSAGTDCSTDSSVMDHRPDPSSQPSALNRFEETPTPQP